MSDKKVEEFLITVIKIDQLF